MLLFASGIRSGVHVEEHVPVANWQGVASDSTGDYLTAVGEGIYIFNSIDGGNKWFRSVRSAAWTAVASNKDGSLFIAVSSDGLMYYTDNRGAVWNLVPYFKHDKTQHSWVDVSCSSIGKYVAVAENPGCIYVSDGSGFVSSLKTVWNKVNPYGSSNNYRYWTAIEIDGSGTFMLAAEYDGYLYTGSLDGSGLWKLTQSTTSGDQPWTGIALNQDHTVLFACYGQTVFKSINNKDSWKAVPLIPAIRDCKGITVDKTGSRLALITSTSYIYISSDQGNTWLQSESIEQEWSDIAPSKYSNGMNLVACGLTKKANNLIDKQSGYVSTSADYGKTWGISSIDLNAPNATHHRSDNIIRSHTTAIVALTIGFVFMMSVIVGICYYSKYGCHCCNDEGSDEEEEAMIKDDQANDGIEEDIQMSTQNPMRYLSYTEEEEDYDNNNDDDDDDNANSRIELSLHSVVKTVTPSDDDFELEYNFS